MPVNLVHTYLFLNDLHLAGGFDPVNNRSSRGENFFYDAEFARFLDFHISQAASKGAQVHLVLLGDVFDFLRIESPTPPQHRYSLDSSPATAVAKLRRIAAEHAKFFQALGRLLDAGGVLEILPGNHDIELIRQPVQSVFKELVAAACQKTISAEQIRFHPWVLYVPGAFYAEHGQQHHFINNFPDLLFLHYDQPPGAFRLPPGSHFELYLSDLARLAAPHLNEQPAGLLALLRILLRHPALWLAAAASHLRFAAALLQDLLHRPLVKFGRISTEQAQRLQALSAESGLDVPFLSRLEQMTRLSTLEMFQRVIRLLTRQASAQTGGYIYQSALAIHQLLMSSGQAVPCYIFGHTHHSASLPLTSQGPPAFYLNAGSWIGMGLPGGSAPVASRDFRFVRLTIQPGAAPSGEILTWEDALRRAQPVSG